jgi:hypothetical protein
MGLKEIACGGLLGSHYVRKLQVSRVYLMLAGFKGNH